MAAKEKISNAAGIGFKIPEGFYFIDIDDRIAGKYIPNYADIFSGIENP